LDLLYYLRLSVKATLSFTRAKVLSTDTEFESK